MKSNRVLFVLKKQKETVLFSALFLGCFLVAAILSWMDKISFGIMLLMLLPCLGLSLLASLYFYRWRIAVYEQSIVYQTLFRKRAYQISQIKRVVMLTHWGEGEILWLYTQDGAMISISSRCKNFERFHRYIQKKRAVEWESP